MYVPLKLTNILVPDCDLKVAVPSLPQRGQNLGTVTGIGKALSAISELHYKQYIINNNLPSLLLLDVGSK